MNSPESETPSAALPLAEAPTLWGLLERRVELTPDRVMLRDEFENSVTFAEFHRRSEILAAGLQDLGIGPGSPVTWQLPTRVESIVLSMALSRLGAVQNPIIHLYREREVSHLLETTGATHYIVQGTWKGFDYAAMGRQIESRINSSFDILEVDAGLPEGDPTSLPPVPLDADHDSIRWIYTTSGTTSAPKCVQHTDATLIAGGIGICETHEIGPADATMIAYPYAHIGGPIQLVSMLRTARPSVLMEAYVPSRAVELVNQYKVTFAGASTAFYLAYMNEQRTHGSDVLMPSLKTLTGGGAPKPPAVFWEARKVLGITIQHGYGMTECPMMTNGRWNDSDEQLANTDGAPVAGCEIKIIDSNNESLPAGTDGEIVVRGPMLTKGYTDAKANAEAFLDGGFFRTGDRGLLREDGHIVITGRVKEIIIRKGENISPKEIEDVLMNLPEVGAVAVIGLPDSDRGERVCAVVEMLPGQDPLTFADMKAHCKTAQMMIQKFPEQLEVVDALPRNPTMKILKTELVKRFTKESDD